jgi:hypothetical protein
LSASLGAASNQIRSLRVPRTANATNWFQVSTYRLSRDRSVGSLARGQAKDVALGEGLALRADPHMRGLARGRGFAIVPRADACKTTLTEKCCCSAGRFSWRAKSRRAVSGGGCARIGWRSSASGASRSRGADPQPSAGLSDIPGYASDGRLALWRNNFDQRREAPKIRFIERQQPAFAMRQHRRYDVGVVDLATPKGIGAA